MSAFTRRAVLMAGGAAAVFGAALGRRAESAPSQMQRQPQPLLWLDVSLPQATLRPDTLLGPELVGQWRQQLLAQLRGHGKPVSALVRWDKAMLLSGLAREEGIKTRTQRLRPGVYRVDVNV